MLADHGSDINNIWPDHVRTLGLEVKDASELDYRPLNITVSIGQGHRLQSYVKIIAKVGGVTPEIWTFVAPVSYKALGLLRGRLWLDSVDAHIHLRNSQIYIGNIQKGEKWECLQGPLYIENHARKHLLILAVAKHSKDEASNDDSSDSDSSEETTDSEKDSSNSEADFY